MNPEDIHRSIPKKNNPYQFYSIRFFREEVEAFSDSNFDILACFYHHDKFNHRVQLEGDQFDHLLKLINKMEYYLSVECKAYGKEVFIKTLLAEILVYVNYLYSIPSATGLIPSDTEVAALRPVFTYIQDHLNEDLSLDILAKQLFLNKYYLSHKFKDIMGFTLKDFIIHRRISEAKRLLRAGHTVSFAGESAGFKSIAHFIRTFEKYETISPKQYAKRFLVLENYWTPSPPHRDAFLMAPPKKSKLLSVAGEK